MTSDLQRHGKNSSRTLEKIHSCSIPKKTDRPMYVYGCFICQAKDSQEDWFISFTDSFRGLQWYPTGTVLAWYLQGPQVNSQRFSINKTIRKCTNKFRDIWVNLHKLMDTGFTFPCSRTVIFVNMPLCNVSVPCACVFWSAAVCWPCYRYPCSALALYSCGKPITDPHLTVAVQCFSKKFISPAFLKSITNSLTLILVQGIRWTKYSLL